MAQASATTTTVNQNGIARKMDDMTNNLSSSPRRTAIGKPSLRLSIPTIEQIAETKTQAKLNQTDPGNKKSGDSFVKRMIDNCNHSGQLPSNVDIITSNDGPSNTEHAAEVCDMNRVKSVIEKLDKNKRMSIIANGKSPTDATMASATAAATAAVAAAATATTAIVNVDVDKKSTRKPSIEIHIEDKCAKDNDDIASGIESNGAQHLDNFLSYSKFENDFKKRINELNSGRLDAQSHGMNIFTIPFSSSQRLTHRHKHTKTHMLNGLTIQMDNEYVCLFSLPHTYRSSPAIIDTNQKYFHIDTQHTLAHPEASSKSDCQPQSDHSL